MKYTSWNGVRGVNYDAFANRRIARSCASPEVSGMACFRAIFSFHLLRIYDADLPCLVCTMAVERYTSYLFRSTYHSRELLGARSYAPRAPQIFYSSREVIDASIYSSRELIQLIKNLDKEGHDGAE